MIFESSSIKDPSDRHHIIRRAFAMHPYDPGKRAYYIKQMMVFFRINHRIKRASTNRKRQCSIVQRRNNEQ